MLSLSLSVERPHFDVPISKTDPRIAKVIGVEAERARSMKAAEAVVSQVQKLISLQTGLLCKKWDGDL